MTTYSYDRTSVVIPFKTQNQLEDESANRLQGQLEGARESAKRVQKLMKSVASQLRDVYSEVQTLHMLLNRVKYRAERDGHTMDVKTIERVLDDMRKINDPVISDFPSSKASEYATSFGGLAVELD